MASLTYGHKSDQAPEDGEGQGSLAGCSPWGSQRVGHDWVTETTTIFTITIIITKSNAKDKKQSLKTV